jgi:hypothetical protein
MFAKRFKANILRLEIFLILESNQNKIKEKVTFKFAFFILPLLSALDWYRPSGPILRSRADSKGNMKKAMY